MLNIKTVVQGVGVSFVSLVLLISCSSTPSPNIEAMQSQRKPAAEPCPAVKLRKVKTSDVSIIQEPTHLVFPLLDQEKNASFREAPNRFGSSYGRGQLSNHSRIGGSDCQPVRAIAGGTVIRAYERALTGSHLVEIQHDDSRISVYSGLSSQKADLKQGKLAIGQRVRAGEIIGFLQGAPGGAALYLQIYEKDFIDPTRSLEYSAIE